MLEVETTLSRGSPVRYTLSEWKGMNNNARKFYFSSFEPVGLCVQVVCPVGRP